MGHDALPWHGAAYFGDDRFTLDPQTADLLEAEASACAAETLFQIDRFTDEANGFRLGLEVPLGLAERWQVSRHAAMRRYVESSPRACALLVIGRFPVTFGDHSAVRVLRSFESAKFRSRYGIASQRIPCLLDERHSGLARDALSALRGELSQPVAAGRLRLDAGTAHDPLLDYEVTSNTYSAFALISEKPRLQPVKRMRAIWTPGAPRQPFGVLIYAVRESQAARWHAHLSAWLAPSHADGDAPQGDGCDQPADGVTSCPASSMGSTGRPSNCVDSTTDERISPWRPMRSRKLSRWRIELVRTRSIEQ